MDEAQRFLRYVTPGLTFIILTASYSYFSQHDWTLQATKDFLLKDSIGTAIGLFFTSGGIGFLLSVFHHFLFWSCAYSGLATDHWGVLEHAIREGHLKLQPWGLDKEAVGERRLGRAGAWRVVSSIWHERRESSTRIKGADQRTKSLSDIMHGAGTAFLGSIAALFMWLWLHGRHASFLSLSFLLTLFGALAVVGVHSWNFRQTIKHCQGVVDIVLSDELRLERLHNKEPVVVIVSANDFVR